MPDHRLINVSVVQQKPPKPGDLAVANQTTATLEYAPKARVTCLVTSVPLGGGAEFKISGTLEPADGSPPTAVEYEGMVKTGTCITVNGNYQCTFSEGSW